MPGYSLHADSRSANAQLGDIPARRCTCIDGSRTRGAALYGRQLTCGNAKHGAKIGAAGMLRLATLLFPQTVRRNRSMSRGLFGSWKRKRTLARTRIDAALWQRVIESLPFLRGLSPPDLEQLRELAVLFLAEKEMHGAAGFELTDEVRLSIAVQACLPVLKLELAFYRGWIGIVVYPGEFRVNLQEVDADGVVHEFEDELSGEAWPGGPVVLSWADAMQDEAGYNVVIHEFAHKIHMLRGGDDDFPAPHAEMDEASWRETLADGYELLCAQVDAGKATLVDPYAAGHPAEFFAVMSEMFFTSSEILARDWPDLYRELATFYRQDPAERMGTMSDP